jgi:AhpD family alkylhydroperoxidase
MKMATIRLVEENEASPEVKAIYEESKRHFNIDFVPNVFKAMAHNPELLKMQWEGLMQGEKMWGKETFYLVSLAVDVTNSCDYCINADTAMLKQIGYDDAKIESLINMIALNSYYNHYVDGLQLEPDVTPTMAERGRAMKMPTIRLVEENEASADVKAVYDDIKRHFNLDFVPSVFKAMAHNPEALKMGWEGFKQAEEVWGKEKMYLIGLAVDITNGCDYCINFDTAMLKRLGYDDAKIESLINVIAGESYFNRYADGLQLEPDITPAVVERRRAA